MGEGVLGGAWSIVAWVMETSGALGSFLEAREPGVPFRLGVVGFGAVRLEELADRRSRERRLKRLGPSAFSSSAYLIHRGARGPGVVWHGAGGLWELGDRGNMERRLERLSPSAFSSSAFFINQGAHELGVVGYGAV